MKKYLPFFSFLLFTIIFFSCKKAVENKQQDLITSAIVDGIWVVDQYLEGTNNITNDFLNYDFKFNSNGTVSGTKASNATVGTWSSNISNYSITSNFPSANDPLQKMNGVWIITDSYWDFVKAEMTTSGGKNILHLRKKP